jgi:hypothetical protein
MLKKRRFAPEAILVVNGNNGTNENIDINGNNEINESSGNNDPTAAIHLTSVVPRI